MTRDRYWPRWLCRLFGHEPTEPASFERDWLRCRCGRFECGSVFRFDRCISWWNRFVRRLP
jgi:hypothetical protein